MMWQPSSLALHNLWQINAPGMSNRPDEACTPGRGSRVAAEVLCLARRKPAGAQGHCEDCGLWACARDPLKAPLHRICLHQMVSPFLHKHPTSNAQRIQLLAAFPDRNCAADRPPTSLLLPCRTSLAAEGWGMLCACLPGPS